MFITNLSNTEYHKHNALSASGLKSFMKSPAHYQQYLADKSREDGAESTNAMILGGYIHSLILEPEKAVSEYAIQPDGLSLATKDGKEWKSQNADKIIIKYADSITAENAKKSLYLNPLSKRLLTGGIAESSIFWKDDETGIECKIRPDYLINDNNFIIDLKTTTDSSPASFKKSSWNLNYHIQASFYQRGIYAEFGEWFDFLIIAIEKDNPFLPAVIYSLDADLKEKADSIINEQLRYFSDCTQKKEWPGYVSGIQVLSAPDWA